MTYYVGAETAVNGTETYTKCALSGQIGLPCTSDPLDLPVTMTGNYRYKNGTVIAVKTSNGKLEWAKRQSQSESVPHLSCLARKKGILGCSNRYGQTALFMLDRNGQTLWNNFIEAGSPVSCGGFHSDTQEAWVLLSSDGKKLSRSGNLDPIIFHIDVDGEMNYGTSMVFKSSVNLGAGISVIGSGAVFIAGSVRKVLEYDY